MSRFQEPMSDLSLAVHSGAIPLAKRVLRFRILCERADGTIAQVRIVSTLAEARGACKVLAERHLERLKKQRAKIVARPARPRRLYFERWVGDAQCGYWELVDPTADGFTFVFLDRAPRLNGWVGIKHTDASPTMKPTASSKADSEPVPQVTASHEATIRSGMDVHCVLLAKRTRKGGWFAKVVGHTLSGPVTNSSMLPQACQSGDVMAFKVCGVKVETGFVQLAYVSGLPTTDG